MATVYCDEFVKLLNRDEYETIVMVVFDVPAVVVEPYFAGIECVVLQNLRRINAFVACATRREKRASRE